MDALAASVEQRVAAGTVYRNPDSEVRWVRVTDARGGEAVVQDCRIIGPLSGSYDASTGEKVEEGQSAARIVEFYFSPIDIDGEVAHRVAGTRSGEDPERCRE